MKKSVKMIFIVTSIIIFITLICQVKSFATDVFGISLQADSIAIQNNQTEAKFYITLTDYNPTDKGEAGFIPTLGYEAVLEYDNNVFESVTIESLNNWNDVEYYESTGKILATTKNAKANTKIAQITLKLKSNANVEKTTILLKNMIVSDGKSTITLNPSIEFNFEKGDDTQNNSGDASSNNVNNPSGNTNNSTTTTDDGQKDTNSQPSTPSNGQEGNANSSASSNGQTTTNDAQEKNNISDTQNNNSNSNQSSNNQTNINNNQETKVENTANPVTTEEQIKVDIAKDRTTSDTAIPQTGEGTITLVIMIIAIGISIVFFMRYRYINRKIKGI